MPKIASQYTEFKDGENVKAEGYDVFPRDQYFGFVKSYESGESPVCMYLNSEKWYFVVSGNWEIRIISFPVSASMNIDFESFVRQNTAQAKTCELVENNFFHVLPCCIHQIKGHGQIMIIVPSGYKSETIIEREDLSLF